MIIKRVGLFSSDGYGYKDDYFDVIQSAVSPPEIIITPKDAVVGAGAATLGTGAGVSLYKLAKKTGKWVSKNPRISKNLGRVGAAGVGIGITGSIVDRYRNSKYRGDEDYDY